MTFLVKKKSSEVLEIIYDQCCAEDKDKFTNPSHRIPLFPTVFKKKVSGVYCKYIIIKAMNVS